MAVVLTAAFGPGPALLVVRVSSSAAPRVFCGEHGVVVAHVPWARPGAKCSHVFEDTCAWLAA